MQIFSDISLWWTFPWAVTALVLAVLYYRKQKALEEASTLKRWMLTALRAISLFLLGILLFGLIIESKEYKTEKPVFINLVDNSSSLLNYRDSLNVAEGVSALKQELTEKYGERFEFKHYVVGSEMAEGDPDFTAQQSNLDLGFEAIYNQYYNRNIGGICFISDGNFNVGKNPIYSAEKISLTPVFTIGVGDTIQKRDQLIRNLAVNDVAFLNNQFPIEVDLEAHKMEGVSSEVSLWSGGKKLASQTVNYQEEMLDFVHVSFVLEAQQVGFVNYTIQLEKKDNESSYENNVRSFYVEVIDSRSKVLMLAKAPHPDLTAVRQVLGTDENIEVVSQLADDWDGQLNDYALIIWHDPGYAANTELVRAIRLSKTPVLYMIGSQSTRQYLERLNIGLDYPAGNRLDEVQGSIDEAFQLFEVSDDLKKAMRDYPPLKVRFGAVQLKGASTLVAQRIGPVVKKDPVIAFSSSAERKYGVVLGEGLWQWRLSEFAKHGDSKRFAELIQKTVQFLTVKKNTEPLRINLPNRFNTIDDVIINAEFYNSSFERITEPEISFVLTNAEEDPIKYVFAKNSADYLLSIGKLPEGKYAWTASTTFDGRKYVKSGVFVIDDVSLEALATHANHNLLNQISEKTSGQFYTLANSSNIVTDLSMRKDIANITYEASDFDDLIDWKWIFFLLILTLTGEWFIRRYSGSY